MGDEIAALTRKIDALQDEISAMHRTLGVLLDDMAEVKVMELDIRAIHGAMTRAMTQMSARVRKLESNGKAA